MLEVDALVFNRIFNRCTGERVETGFGSPDVGQEHCNAS